MAFIDRYGNRQEGTGSFVDYYKTKPTLPNSDNPIDITPPVIENPFNPNYLTGTPAQQDDGGGATAEQESDMRFNLDGISAGTVDYSQIKHSSYEDYLKSTNYTLDRSGIFSSTQFPDVTGKGYSDAKRMGIGEAMLGLTPIAGPIISQFDTVAVDSALGQTRFAQRSGIGNIAVTNDLIDEYDGLNQIKNDKLNNMATPEAYDYLNFDYGYGLPSTAQGRSRSIGTKYFGDQLGGIKDEEIFEEAKKTNFTNIGQGKGFAGDTGHAFTIGNRTAYRVKGSTMYKGLPQGMSQNVAKSVEALQNGKNPYNYDPNSDSNEDVVVSRKEDGTLTGGYRTDGRFVSVSGQVAQYGYMDDFVNMAREGFKSGNLTQKEAQSFARGWLESSRTSAMRNASAADRLANLNSWKQRAMNAGKMSAAQKKKNKVNLWNIKKKKVVLEGTKTSGMTQEQKEDQFRQNNQQTAAQNRVAATRGVSQTITYSDDSSDDFDSGGVGQGGDSYGGLEFAQGGQVGMAEGDQVAPSIQDGTAVAPNVVGQDDGDMVLSANELMEGQPESGFIRKPSSQTTDEEGVTDDNPTLAPNEKNPRGAAIIINKQAVDQMGEKDAVKMIEEARAYLRSKGGEEANLDENNPEGMSEIITADGEIMIQPEEADVIGRKRLLALNERGKKATRAVKKKVKPKQGGFIEANEGLEVSSVDPDRFSKVWSQYKGKITGGTQAENNNKSRDKAQQLLKQFTDQELLAFVMLSEGSTLGEEGAEGIAHVILNRINSEEADFKKIEDVYGAITKRQKGKNGNRVFQFQGLEPTPLKKYLRLLNNKDPKTTEKYKQYVNIADEVIAGARKDFTNNSTFFWDPRNSYDTFMVNSVKSGKLIPQGRTKVGNYLHEYLKMSGKNRQSTMPNEEEIMREGRFNAMIENSMMNSQRSMPNLNAQSQGGGFISRYTNKRARPLVSLN